MRGPLTILTKLGVPPPWTMLLLATPLLTASYLLLPTTGIARVVAYPMFGLIATAAVLIGIRWRHPARPGAWRLIALGLALLSVGDTTYTLLSLGGDVPYPSLADIPYLAAYAALVSGIIGLFRGRVAGGDRTAIVDAAVLSAGAGSLFWIAIVRPSLQGSVDDLAAFVSMIYPAMDLILLTLCIRVMLTGAARTRFFQFLVAGIAVYLVADIVYVLTILQGTYVEGQPVDAGWIAGVLLMGVAALHPSVSVQVAPAEADDARLSRVRLGMLAAAALIAPAILLFSEIQQGDDAAVGLVIEWTLLFGLVFIRLATTVKELGASLRERRRLQVDLAYQANHDPLTRIANRLLFESRLTAAMANAPERTALIFMDIDDFKAVNDTLGHPTGDEVLRIIAGRVQRQLRAGDLVARIGGDELAILVEGCDDIEMVRSVAERALSAVRAPISSGGRQLHVNASAGVSLGHVGANAVDLMRDADIAMYQAKSHGKDQVENFQPAMLGEVVRNYELRTELVEAVETEAFVVHYQPAINLNTGAIIGAEALVRWNHPERGLLFPQQFIPQSEATGAIHPLGRWILREACRTAVSWPTRLDGERPAMSVNLAASQLLQPSMVEVVASVLAETGMPPNKLCLEVTETALVDIVPARAALRRLHELGVYLALDDFGTGYSALNYLAELPFDIIKIDRSFIGSIGNGRRVDALLQGILALCKSMDLMTIAEGIETESQLAHLRALGCELGQGYFFSRPVPAAAFEGLLLAEKTSSRRVPAWLGFGGQLLVPEIAP
jgi:diguanylate cyclase (GGDEF)-like protein